MESGLPKPEEWCLATVSSSRQTGLPSFASGVSKGVLIRTLMGDYRISKASVYH